MNLKQSIEQLYQTYYKLKKPTKIIEYECISCLTNENYLLETPLREIKDTIFDSIMESCNAVEMGNECYKYFIPRILELTTLENYDFDWAFLEYVYRDFAKFDYQNRFDKKEVKAIDDFFYSFLERGFFLIKRR